MSQLENALAALARGFKIFPCWPSTKRPAGDVVPHGVLEASADEGTIRRWWAVNPRFNPAVTNGTIVDVDEGLNSLEDAKAFAKLNQFPPTLVVRTGRRPAFGAQFHFSGEAVNGLYVACGVSGEIRAKGEYGMAPGSVHPSGVLYEIAVDLPRALVPENLLRAFRKRPPSSKEPKPGFKVGKGERFYWLRSQCGRLVNAGLTGDALFAALKSLNEKFCEPPKPDSDLRQLADAGTEKFSASVEPPPSQRAEDSERLESERKRDEAWFRLLNWIADRFPAIDSEKVYQDAALLSLEQYESLRPEILKGLGIRAEALELFVAKRRPKETTEDDSQVEFKPSLPWSEPVNGDELLTDIAKTLRRFIVFQFEYDAEVMAAWSLATHLYNEFKVLSRLGFTSLFPDSGKTTCIDCMEHLCQRAVRGDNISVSIFYRVMEMHHPSFILDELDTFIRDNPVLVGVLNSGHRKGGFVWRTNSEDEKMRPERFGTYGPVCYGMLGHPVGTLYSRTIFIRLKQKKADQKVEDFDPDEYPEQGETMTELRRKMVRWAEDHRAEVRDVKPDTGNLANRARNNWRCLLKIAEVAGGNWSKILLTAAGAPPPLSKKTAQEKLLRDVRNIFHTRNVDRISSYTLIEDLHRQTDSGWNRYQDGRTPIDAAGLADLLIDFNIQPKVHRFNAQGSLDKAKDVTKRGYLLADFQPFIETYLGGVETEVVPISDEKP